MESLKVFVFFGITALIIAVSASPVDAGIVQMVTGAYSGIPYDSLSEIGNYQRPDSRSTFSQDDYPRVQQLRPQLPSPVVISPNYRAAGLERRSHGPVQIYRLPGVVAPGVMGTLSQIGY